MRISRAGHVQLKNIVQRFDSSQRSIAAAAPAFSDSAPDIGIYTAWSQAFAVAPGNPGALAADDDCGALREFKLPEFSGGAVQH